MLLVMEYAVFVIGFFLLDLLAARLFRRKSTPLLALVVESPVKATILFIAWKLVMKSY